MFRLSKYNVIEKANEGVIVFNRITGKMALFQIKCGKDLSSEDINSLDANTLLKLYEYRIIVEEAHSESSEYQMESNLQRVCEEHLTLTITPSLQCNFNCSYCFQTSSSKDTMSDDTVDAMIAFIVDKTKKVKSLHINWYGGEPLLHLDKIKKISSKILELIPASVKYTSSIITNGYLLNNVTDSDLRKLHVNWIQVTLDGDKKNHNITRMTNKDASTFDTIMTNIVNMSKHIFMIVRVNTSKSNINSSRHLINELKPLKNIKNLFVYFSKLDNLNNTCKNQCVDLGNYTDYINRMAITLDKQDINALRLPSATLKICMAVALNAYVIGPDGSLYKCINTIGMYNEVVGSIFDSYCLNENNSKWINYQIDDFCIDCTKLPSCNGGCPYSKLQNSHRECSKVDVDLKTPMLKELKKKELLVVSI